MVGMIVFVEIVFIKPIEESKFNQIFSETLEKEFIKLENNTYKFNNSVLCFESLQYFFDEKGVRRLLISAYPKKLTKDVLKNLIKAFEVIVNAYRCFSPIISFMFEIRVENIEKAKNLEDKIKKELKTFVTRSDQKVIVRTDKMYDTLKLIDILERLVFRSFDVPSLFALKEIFGGDEK